MVIKMSNLFDDLESNNLQKVEEFKSKLKEQFNAIKEPWVLNGIYHYYLITNSVKAVDVLVSVKEPHDKHYFDRALDGIRSNNKLPHLTLLGYIVHRRPIWLYRISSHPILKELLNLLKVETTDMLTIVSALLIIIILLPLIPGLISQYLSEIFAVFSKLAGVNTNSNSFHEAQLVHLQISLYTLFHRLYGMFPCNFVSYLRKEYSTTETSPVFSHTVKPMLDTMRVNPLLITANEEWEVSATRWKNVEPHDIIVSCAKLLINGNSTYEANASNFETKTSFNCKSMLGALKVTSKQTIADCCERLSKVTGDATLWSPSVRYLESKRHDIESTPTMIPLTPIVRGFEVSSPYSEHEGSSPPEAAIEATPETTPIRDYLNVSSPVLVTMTQRSLTTFTKDSPLQGTKVPISDRSFPSSPIKKEPSSFRYSAPEIIPMMNVQTHGLKKLDKMLSDRNKQTDEKSILEKVEMTPVQSYIRHTNDLSSNFRRDSCHMMISQETESSFVAQPCTVNIISSDNNKKEHNGVVACTNEDETNQQIDIKWQNIKWKPCSYTSGGLHRSIRNFAKHISRIRYYSQRTSESRAFSSGTSPQDATNYFVDSKVRRTNSCPEMKKSCVNNALALISITPPGGNIFPEEKKDGDAPCDKRTAEKLRNGDMSHDEEKALKMDSLCDVLKHEKICSGTQTEKIPPYHFPYEHLFLDVFPPLQSVSSVDQISSTESDNSLEEKTVSVYERIHTPSKILKKYIEAAALCHTDKTLVADKINPTQYDTKFLANQLKLMRIQLRFEEHRREMHAERNRRLLGRSRRNKTLEEHNNALTDQVLLLRKELENCSVEIEKVVRETESQIKHEKEAATYWRDQYVALQKEHKTISDRFQEIEAQLNEEKKTNTNNIKSTNESKAALTDVTNQLRTYKKKAEVAKDLQITVAELQAELLKAGEMIIKYRRRLAEVLKTPSEAIQHELMHSAYIDEVNKLKRRINIQSASIKANKTSINNLTRESLEKENYIEKLINMRGDKGNQDELKELKQKHEELKSSYNFELERSNELHYKLSLAKRVSKLQQIPRNVTEYSNPNKSTTLNSGLPNSSTAHLSLDGPNVLKLPVQDKPKSELGFENFLKRNSNTEKEFDVKKLQFNNNSSENISQSERQSFHEIKCDRSASTVIKNYENVSITEIENVKKGIPVLGTSIKESEPKSITFEKCASINSNDTFENIEPIKKESESIESCKPVGKRKTRMECAETGQLRSTSATCIDHEASTSSKKPE